MIFLFTNRWSTHMDVLEMVLIRVWEIFVLDFSRLWRTWSVGSIAMPDLGSPMLWICFFLCPQLNLKCCHEWIWIKSNMNVLGCHVYSFEYICGVVHHLQFWDVTTMYFFYVEHDCFKFKFLIWLPKMFATICICVIQIFKWQIRLLLTHFDFYSVSHLESPPLPKKANINCHLSLTVLPTTCIYMSTSLVLPTDTCQLTAFCCHSLPVCV